MRHEGEKDLYDIRNAASFLRNPVLHLPDSQNHRRRRWPTATPRRASNSHGSYCFNAFPRSDPAGHLPHFDDPELSTCLNCSGR